MARYQDYEILTTEEAFAKLNGDDLKALLRLLGQEPPPRKPELAAAATHVMTQANGVRALYEQLDETGKAAVKGSISSRWILRWGSSHALSTNAFTAWAMRLLPGATISTMATMRSR